MLRTRGLWVISTAAFGLLLPSAGRAEATATATAASPALWASAGSDFRTFESIYSLGGSAAVGLGLGGHVFRFRYAEVNESRRGFFADATPTLRNRSLAVLWGRQRRERFVLADFAVGPALVWARKRGAELPGCQTEPGGCWFDLGGTRHEKVTARALGLAVQGGVFAATDWGALGVELIVDVNTEQVMPAALASVRLGRL